MKQCKDCKYWEQVCYGSSDGYCNNFEIDNKILVSDGHKAGAMSFENDFGCILWEQKDE